MEKAVDHYIGEFLAGSTWKTPILRGMADDPTRADASAGVTALQDLALAFGARSDYARMRDFATRQVTLEPWRELHQRMMQALALDGRRSEALAQYERCCEVTRARLGVEPATETTRLYQAIRSGSLKAPPRRFTRPSQTSTVALHNFPLFFPRPSRPREDRDSAGVGLPRPAVNDW
ncbi:MAG: bacterial transcriptional activator domain-containing protein [Caldilineaceae bacterium]